MEIYLVLLALTILIGAAIYYSFVLSPKNKLKRISSLYAKDVVQVIEDLSKLFPKGYQQDDDSISFLRKLSKVKPELKAIATNLGPKVGYLFCDAESIKQVLYNHDAFDKLKENSGALVLFDKALIYQVGNSWQMQRTLLGQSFTFDQIRNEIPSVKKICTKVFGELNKQLKTKSEIELKIVKTCYQVASEATQQFFFGLSSDSLLMKDSNGNMISIADELIALIQESATLTQQSNISKIKTLLFKRKSLQIFPSKREKILYERIIALKSACEQIILSKKQQVLEDPTKYQSSVLYMYLKEMIINKNKEITNDVIIDNFLNMYYTGTAATATVAGTACYYLSMNPEIQKTARQEILNILSSKSSSKNPNQLFEQLTFEDISKMNYIHAIFKETMRIVPPAIGITFRMANRDIKIGEVQVQKGDLINTLFCYSQQNPNVFPDPEVFDPNRWMNNKVLPGYHPFSDGQRSCIGQNLSIINAKCMLAYFLLHFEITRNYSTKYRLNQYTTYGPDPDNLVYFKELVQQ